MRPRVSVLMSVYNGERYLREALESILAQTFADFEFLIMNDGSSDDTAVILSEFSQRDKRVAVFKQDNRGISSSLNRLSLKARGRYLAIMDADDVSLPKRLAKQLEFLDANSF